MGRSASQARLSHSPSGFLALGCSLLPYTDSCLLSQGCWNGKAGGPANPPVRRQPSRGIHAQQRMSSGAFVRGGQHHRGPDTRTEVQSSITGFRDQTNPDLHPCATSYSVPWPQLLHLSELQFLACKMGNILVIASVRVRVLAGTEAHSNWTI